MVATQFTPADMSRQNYLYVIFSFLYNVTVKKAEFQNTLLQYLCYIQITVNFYTLKYKLISKYFFLHEHKNTSTRILLYIHSL